MADTTETGLVIWNELSDNFSHEELYENWELIDEYLSKFDPSTKLPKAVRTSSTVPDSGEAGELVFLTASHSGYTANTLLRSSGGSSTSFRPVGNPEIVSSLPTSGNYDGRVVILSAAVVGPPAYNPGTLLRYYGASWAPIGELTANSVTSTHLADGAVTTSKISNGHVTADKLHNNLKPSAGAAATVESLRRLGTEDKHAAAGNDSRFAPFAWQAPLYATAGELDVYSNENARLELTIPADGTYEFSWGASKLVSSHLKVAALVGTVRRGGPSGTPLASNQAYFVVSASGGHAVAAPAMCLLTGTFQAGDKCYVTYESNGTPLVSSPDNNPLGVWAKVQRIG